jgi:ABC-type taurine transport system ATPase subunit
MDLMGFTDDEGDDLVASFSGGWKMRIGLGKVLLKDPNILLLDEPVRNEKYPKFGVIESLFVLVDETHTLLACNNVRVVLVSP